MAEYFKEPQNPLKRIDEETGDIYYIYPQTTAKQVIMEDGTRLSAILPELHDNIDELNTNISTKQTKHTTATVALLASNWADNTQTVMVNNATETNTVLVGSYPDNYTEYIECGVRCTGQGNKTLTFVCDSVPNSDIQANVMFLE